MKKYLWFYHLILLFHLGLSTVCQAEPDGYGYPYSNPYEATILPTPVDLQAPLPKEIDVKELELTVFPERKIPDVFWYNERLYYSLAAQKEKAPLIFVIAGTGARFDSPKAQMMRNAFFGAGFHVICLSSPTHPNFITTASSTAAPGDIQSDCRDLYRVMTLIWEKAKTKIDASDFYLTGYSLGGSQAAFIAILDETQKNFNFKKVLMINPPISLYDSAARIDQLLVDNIPGGISHFDDFYRRLMKNIENQYVYGDFVDLNHEFFYHAFDKILPTEPEQKAAIGFSFRISAANIIFVTDVMTNSGWIVPKNLELTKSSSTTDYGKIASRAGGFAFYAKNLLLPVLQQKTPELTLAQLIQQSSLTSIEDYLKNSDKVGLVTNEDDFILAQGDIDYLKRIFQARARIYPRGGHCGNMDYKDNVAYMVEYFKVNEKGN
jgi:hypothetical protein